jgi:protein-S-isoprenylcysteine O-methyltransferase Ste14
MCRGIVKDMGVNQVKSVIGNEGGAELPRAHLLQVLYIVLFSVVWLLDSFVFNFSTFLAGFVPLVLRVVFAVIVVALGFGVTSWGHWLLFNKKLWPNLVTVGIFAHVRHPMYLGYMLLYLGFIVGTMSLLSVIPWLLIIHLYDEMAGYEECELEKRFGEKYLEYKRRVPKWILR